MLGSLVAATAAGEPVLHEFIDLGPGSGPIEPAVTGRLGAPRPAAADPGREVGAAEGDDGAGAAAGPNNAPSFSIDSDTSRPASVGYADPFTPTVVPPSRTMRSPLRSTPS